ncbi:MAG TPA: acetyl-CoA hydrolase/transferase C-terminal domain-containing protein [Syntrophomonadaceae bacterium]|nr:4-hydroxybutyrate CoA-transferase [Syntrophomonadaceae bacterium]HOQ09784.1 acetyl-CoA hydrolase/transferase C-terminal domain-containing protein [Syntrophomonadaceae bacterium]HPU48751.1 acetyl-CoA hydrolase/transferase C-terminal domain-containing protein [Syntrophomonadaceae bacterium]
MAISEKRLPRAHVKYANWKEEYQAKLMDAADAAALVKDNDVIMMPGGTCIPHDFSVALSNRVSELRNVTVCLGLALKLYDYMQPQYKEHIHIETPFVGPVERMCLEWKTAQYIPVHLNQLAEWMDCRKPNVTSFVVTPPDENGYMNRSCFGGLVPRRAIQRCDLVIAEVNPRTPWLVSDDLKIHVSEVDVILESDADLVEIPDIPITDVEKQIAQYIVEMIPDGSTVQLGLGGLANAIGYFLHDKKDLGVHTEVVQNSIMELMKSGVVNNSKKNIYPGITTGTFCVGDAKLWNYVNHNPKFWFMEVEKNNDPYFIGQHDNLISINNALMMDLTGQVASESIRHRQYSGTGGQVNFVWGARFSKGGKSIIALNSTFTDREGKLKSRIVPFLPAGTIVSTPRNDVEYIVTEYGVANLRYKSVGERVREMIRLSHPQFRDELLFQAKQIGWI